MSTEASKIVALKIIGMLANRRGFDEWFYGIDNETRQEIVERIAEIICQEQTP